jgi:hypothetical protein
MADGMLQGYESLRRRFAAISGPTFGTALMRDLGLAATRESKLIVPVKTRNLARSIHLAEVTDTSARVVASANYALFVEEDTKPHEITPNAKKALAFASQGLINERFGVQKSSSFRLSGSLKVGAMRQFGNAAFVVVKKVHHPGTKGQHFMRKGAEKAIEGAGLVGKIVATWNEAR